MSPRGPGAGVGPPSAADIVDDELSTIGVDVGGTKLLGVVVTREAAVVAEARRSVPPPERSPSPLASRSGPLYDAVAALVTDLVDEAGAGGRRVDAVGIGLPGQVDRQGRLHVSPNLARGEGLDLVASMPGELGMPVAVENDATCAALGEKRLGAARHAEDAVVVTVGTGIGVGLIVSGEVVRGAAGYAGEAGHMVVQAWGMPCPCGRSGCWERYASGEALGRAARAMLTAGDAPAVLALAGGSIDDVRGEHVTAAAEAGDVDALRLVDELARWLALGITNLGTVLDPQLVVVGGGLVGAGPVVLGPLRRALADPAISGRYPAPVVVEAALGARAGAIGAALLARHLSGGQ